MTIYNNDIVEHRGLCFRVEFPDDDANDAPWERDDGHGPVSVWTMRPKRAGEMLLATEDRNTHRFYDFAAAVKQARAEEWGGPGATAGERAHNAAMADFERLKAWCDDEWQYIGVVVTLLTGPDDTETRTDYRHSLWGVESDCEDYLEETARELMDNIIADLELDPDSAPEFELRPESAP